MIVIAEKAQVSLFLKLKIGQMFMCNVQKGLKYFCSVFGFLRTNLLTGFISPPSSTLFPTAAVLYRYCTLPAQHQAINQSLPLACERSGVVSSHLTAKTNLKVLQECILDMQLQDNRNTTLNECECCCMNK